MRLSRAACRCSLITLTVLACSVTARGADSLCDPSNSNCRTQLLTLIQNEKVGIDVAFWFMQDSRYMNAIIQRWNAGVPVRILIDPRANPTYVGNDQMIAGFQQAGIPLRKRTASGILHWKFMLFAGQNTVEFGSANYSPDAFVPVSPYTNYVAETVFYTDDPAVTNSFKTEFDDAWTDTTSFTNYANIVTPARTYPTYPIDPSMNFPPTENFATRSVARYNAETLKIDGIIYRITDRRHADAIINAHARGVPVRLIVENNQYRDPSYLWDSWNVDRLYTAGIQLRWRGHAGENHEKVTLLYGQNMAIFGSSNWTTASASSQAEHNYFTTKNALFQWFVIQFERMWQNSNPLLAAETTAFAPLPPDVPKYKSPASGATVTTSTATLTWYAGPWAHNYDIYFGTSPTPPLLAANVNLGPSPSTSTLQKYTTPALASGTTYYWKIVSKTMADMAAAGPVASFTTSVSTASALPAGWQDVDIGAVGVSGVASYANNTFSVVGSGTDIWGTADAFNFACQSMTGDGQLVARVASLGNTNSWAKAAVMIRNGLSANAAFADMIVTSAKGTAFQYRASAGASAINVSGPLAAAPYWVKIVRAGSIFSGYVSADGANWTLVGQASIAMGSTVEIGLAVTSHDNTRTTTGAFTNITR